MHMGHIAYVLALANRRKGKEKPSKVTISKDASRRFNITERRNVLKDFLGPPTTDEFDENMEQLIMQT